MKQKVCANPILVVSLVLAMVLTLIGIGCSATPSPASNTDSSSIPVGMSLSVSEPQGNTITDVATAVEAKVHTKSGHQRWTEERRAARYRERTVPEHWK